MRISQLRKLFDRLPAEMSRALGKRDFPVCWYGCAAADFQLIDEINRADSPIGFVPRVHFYTDVRYTEPDCGGFDSLINSSWHLDWLKANEASVADLRFFGNPDKICEVRLISFRHSCRGERQFVLMIDCANQLLEKVAIDSDLKFEIVGEGGGMEGGNGPFRLGNLGAGWSFGAVPRSIFDISGPLRGGSSDPSTWGVPDINDEVSISTLVPFYSETGDSCECCLGYGGLSRVHRVNPGDYPAPSEAWADVLRHHCKYRGIYRNYNQWLNMDHLTELTPKAAQIIARTGCNISLNGISTITPEVASELAGNWGGDFSFDGVKDLSYESAAIFSRMDFPLTSKNVSAFSESAHRGLKAYNRIPRSEVESDRVKNALSILRMKWGTLFPPEISTATEALAITGKKKRRLLVWADPRFHPPWGSWTHLSRGPERREFTKMRFSVNSCIHPLEVDHIEFVNDKDHLQNKKRQRINSRHSKAT